MCLFAPLIRYLPDLREREREREKEEICLMTVISRVALHDRRSEDPTL